MDNIIRDKSTRDFFVYVDPADWLIQHQVGLAGSFASTPCNNGCDSLMFLPNPRFSSAISPFHNNVLRNYRAEYNLEVDRQRWFPQYPSRLQAIFLFDSEDHARCYGTRHPEHVATRILKRVKSSGPYIYSLHDSSWVNFLRQNHSLNQATVNKVSRSYWSGTRVEQCELLSLGKTWTQAPIVEALFIGRIDFYDRSLSTEQVG